NGETVNDAVYQRNRAIEEKYNAKVTQNLVDNPQTELTKVVTAGDDVYDATLLVQTTVTTAAQNGEVLDLYELEYIDFDKPWWSQEVNNRVSIHNKLYFTTSDFMLMDKQRTSILFFNRDMAVDFDLGNPFDYVRDGSWTIDMMTEHAKKVSADLDGDGDIDQHDRHGVGFEWYNTQVMAFATDNVICGKDADDIPVLKMNTPRMISSLDKIMALCSDKTIMHFVQEYNGKYDGDYYSMSGDMFKDGRLLYCASFPQAFKDMSANCKDEYGVIPYPKYDEAQEKYYTLSAQAMLITVPVTTATPDFSGFMLEALSAYSSYTTLPAYYETNCKTKYMYDEDSAEMLDITFDGLIYDLGQLYNWGKIFDVITNVAKAGENNFASQYAAVEAAALAAMEKTVETYMELE
nr:hypothetical protein [Clostridia bacterium]